MALTNTCAANALGVTEPDDYAYAPPGAALAAFAVAGAALGLAGPEVARRMLEASGTAVCELVAAVAKDAELSRPPLIAVGGGAGGLGRHVAAMLRLDCRVPDGAEVISSVGDALSLVRAERERTVDATDAVLVTALMDEVEAEVVAAGASADSVEVRVEERPEKGTVRAVATGAIGLNAGARPGRPPIDAERAGGLAAGHGRDSVRPVGAFWVATSPAGTDGEDGPVLVLDRYGDRLVDVTGVVLGPGEARRRGPDHRPPDPAPGPSHPAAVAVGDPGQPLHRVGLGRPRGRRARPGRRHRFLRRRDRGPDVVTIAPAPTSTTSTSDIRKQRI